MSASAVLTRLVRLLVVGFLGLAAALTSWYGTSIAAYDFTRAHQDSNYTAIGGSILLLGAVATAGTWLLLREEIGQRRMARALFAVAVFALPAGLGAANSVYQEALRPTYPYPGSSLGYSFDYSRGYWTFLPPERDDVAAETVWAMNWVAFTPDDSVPPGGLKVRIGPDDVAPLAGEPFVVGKGEYPGTLARHEGSGNGGAHTLAIVYTAHGRDWRIAGFFAEPPDARNPNTARFFTIVGSLRHDR